MVVALSVLLAVLSQAPAGGPLTVSAAISLGEALEDAAAAFRGSGGAAIALNLAGSNVLARQIAAGAPVDVFISADDAQMDVVERAGLIVPGTRVPLVGNQLVVVVEEGRSDVASIQDLASARIRRIAIGDPEAVPAGLYARLYLERIGLWAQLAPRVVPSSNVRAALVAVQNGAADAAIVYATDARIASGVRVAVSIGGRYAPRIVYPAAVVKASRQPAEAARFLAFLQTAGARRIFEARGFVPAAGS
jgi:molybdate transport system substrate-binding protein